MRALTSFDPMFSPDRLADGVAWVHLGFVAFVILGFASIVAGAVCRWEPVRNFWFRSLHLCAIGFVAARSWLPIPCPLTALEHGLRTTSAAAPGGRALHLAHVGVFAGAEPVPFAVGTTAFFALTLVAYVAYGPRPFRGPRELTRRVRDLCSCPHGLPRRPGNGK